MPVARKQTDHRERCNSTRGREPRNRASLSSLSSSPESCYPSVEIVTEHRKLGFSRERVKPSRRYSQITRSEGFWRFCKHPANRSLIPLRGLAFLSNLPFQRLLPFRPGSLLYKYSLDRFLLPISVLGIQTSITLNFFSSKKKRFFDIFLFISLNRSL